MTSLSHGEDNVVLEKSQAGQYRSSGCAMCDPGDGPWDPLCSLSKASQGLFQVSP